MTTLLALATLATALGSSTHGLPIIRDWRMMDCLPYAKFSTALERYDGEAKITQTIETPSFPGLTRLVIVTFLGTKEVFGGREKCVIIPALFVDTVDDVKEPVPFLLLGDDPPPPERPGI